MPIASLAVALVACPEGVDAAYCAGASHMGCYEGVDRSGRSPGALYDAAAEGLREARTPAERDRARRAMKDAFNPAMSDQRAIEYNRVGGGPERFQRCMQGPGAPPGVTITVPCQQNLVDGRILVDGHFLVAGVRFNVSHCRSQSSSGDGWSHGECLIRVAKGTPQ